MACRREDGEPDLTTTRLGTKTPRVISVRRSPRLGLKSLAFCFMLLADVIFFPASLEEMPSERHRLASLATSLPSGMFFSDNSTQIPESQPLFSRISTFAFYKWDLLRRMHIIEGIRRLPSLVQLLWYSICNRSLSGLNYCCPGVLRSQFLLLGPCRDGCLFVHLV